jgi:hypothetical protein
MNGGARRPPGNIFEGFRGLEYAEGVQTESFLPKGVTAWRHLGCHQQYFTAAYHDESIKLPRYSYILDNPGN